MNTKIFKKSCVGSLFGCFVVFDFMNFFKAGVIFPPFRFVPVIVLFRVTRAFSSVIIISQL